MVEVTIFAFSCWTSVNTQIRPLLLVIVDKRDYADLFSFCSTERFIIKEITSYSVSDRFGSRRVAPFAYHLVRCSKKLCGY